MSDCPGLCCDFKIAKQDTVFLDFTGKKVQSLSLNNTHFTQNDIEFDLAKRLPASPKSELLVSANKLEIQFENEYNNDGNGLHSFVDTDGNQYIYNQSEPSG